jgi:roadblock/LC7 domain-containing protein
MATLDELLKIDGVVAAGEFTADGKLGTISLRWTCHRRWPQ